MACLGIDYRGGERGAVLDLSHYLGEGREGLEKNKQTLRGRIRERGRERDRKCRSEVARGLSFDSRGESLVNSSGKGRGRKRGGIRTTAVPRVVETSN